MIMGRGDYNMPSVFERGAARGTRHPDRDGTTPAKRRGAPFFLEELLGDTVDLYGFTN